MRYRAPYGANKNQGRKEGISLAKKFESWDKVSSVSLTFSFYVLDQLLRLSFTPYIKIANTLIAALTFEDQKSLIKALFHFTNVKHQRLSSLNSVSSVLPITMQTCSLPECIMALLY